MNDMMTAVAWNPATEGFETTTGPVPQPEGSDLLVAVRAASINPVDLKTRSRQPKDAPPKILGYDACGTVLGAGPDAAGFTAGDRVWYAGDSSRPGSDATHQLVDSRIVSKAPQSLDDADAAALPLTVLTAWEALFDRMRLVPLSATAQPERLLVINGAGGVGSILIQLAALSGIQVTATASRPETRDWCRKMGATDVVDHAALADLPDNAFERIFCAYDTDANFPQMTRLVAPEGMICSIVGAQAPLDMQPLFLKSAGFCWEYMFARPTWRTPDIAAQGDILAEVARLFDAGKLKPTRTTTLDGLTPETVAAGHAQVAAGRQIGKIALVW